MEGSGWRALVPLRPGMRCDRADGSLVQGQQGLPGCLGGVPRQRGKQPVCRSDLQVTVACHALTCLEGPSALQLDSLELHEVEVAFDYHNHPPEEPTMRAQFQVCLDRLQHCTKLRTFKLRIQVIRLQPEHLRLLGQGEQAADYGAWYPRCSKV